MKTVSKRVNDSLLAKLRIAKPLNGNWAGENDGNQELREHQCRWLKGKRSALWAVDKAVYMPLKCYFSKVQVSRYRQTDSQMTKGETEIRDIF